MKRICGLILISVVLVGILLPQAAHCQELSTVMEEFKNVCCMTRDAIGRRDRQALEQCREGVYRFSRKDIGRLTLTPIDTLQKEMSDTLLRAIADVKYVDELLRNGLDFSRVKYAVSSSNRGPSQGDS